MLNIEKYKEMLIDEDVINVDNLAIVKNNPTNCTGQCAECDFGKGKSKCIPHLKNGFSQNTKSQKLTGQKSRLIHLYWLEIQKRKNGKKDILLDLKTEKSMLGMTV